MGSADVMMPLDVEAMPPTMSDQLTPRSASQTLVGYQENHQIELFMQEMLGTVFSMLPEDPFEYMTYHIANHRPAPPPTQDDTCCGSGALWVLLPGGDLLNAEHWRLRRCWLADNGAFCISNTSANVSQADGGGLLISPPANVAPHRVSLELGASFREYIEEEAARPFAFSVAAGPGRTAARLHLAAGSEEQRDEWFRLFGHFADADLREGPPPRSEKVLSPRIVEPFSAPSVVAAPVQQANFQTIPAGGYPSRGPSLHTEERPKPQPATFNQVTGMPPVAPLAIGFSDPNSVPRTAPLKPILKSKPTNPGPSTAVPAIRIPRRISDDPMEASNSTRRTSIRFSNDVERREFAVARAEPVPLKLRAHESRRKPAVTMGTQARPPPEQAALAPSLRSPHEGTAAADFIDVNLLPPPPPLPVGREGQEMEESMGKSAPPPTGPPAPPSASGARAATEESTGKSAPPPVGPPLPPRTGSRPASVDETAKASMTPLLSREQALAVAAKVLSETLGVQDGDSEKRTEDVRELLGSMVENMEASPVESPMVSQPASPSRAIASSHAEAIASRLQSLAAEAAPYYFPSRPPSSCCFSAASSDLCGPVIQSLVGGLMAEVDSMIVEDQLLLRPSTAEIESLTDQVLSARIAADAPGEVSREEAKVLVAGVVSSVFDEPQMPAEELSKPREGGELERLTEVLTARSGATTPRQEAVTAEVFNDLMGKVVLDLFAPAAANEVLSVRSGGQVSAVISESNAPGLTSDLPTGAVDSASSLLAGVARPGPREIEVLTERLMRGRGGTVDDSFDITDDLVGNIIGDIFDRPLQPAMALRRTSDMSEEHQHAAMLQHAQHFVDRESLAAGLQPEVVEDIVQRTVQVLIKRTPSGSRASSGPQAPSASELLAMDWALLSHRSKAPSMVDSLAESEAIGDVAADMLDAMMLDPILSLMEEPLDPALVLLGDSQWDATFETDPSSFFGFGTSAPDFIDVTQLSREAVTGGPLSSRSMGAFSATHSELYADVFEDAAMSLVDDIFERSRSAGAAPQDSKASNDASFGMFSSRSARSSAVMQDVTMTLVEDLLQTSVKDIDASAMKRDREEAKLEEERKASGEEVSRKAAKAAETRRTAVVARAAAEAAEAKRETKAPEDLLPEPSPELRGLFRTQQPASDVVESAVEDVQQAVTSEMLQFLLGNYERGIDASDLDTEAQDASGTADSQVAMFTDPFGLERTLVDRETSLISVDESTCNEDLARLISDRLMSVSLGPTPVMTPSYTNRDKHRLVGFEEEEESSAAMKATLEVAAEEAKALERLEVIAEEAKAVSQAMDMAVLRRPSDAEFAAIAADAKVVSQALANAALGATLASKAVSEASGIGGTAAADFIDVVQLPSALGEAPSKRPSTAEIASLAADAEAFSQALEEAASKRPSTADIASLATDAKAVSQALASVVFNASSKSGASGAASEPFNLGWSFAGTETADAIDVSMLPEDEAPLSLHFHELDFKKVDHAAFRDELLDGFRSLGYPEEKVTKLHVTLREGSVIADIRGPLDCLQHLKAMPMNSLQVMGSWAVVRMPGMEELGLPETSQKRSLTGISGISDDSKAGSYVEENMASAIVTGFMRTTSPQASPQASPQELGLPENSQPRALTGISGVSHDSKEGSHVEESMAVAMVTDFISATPTQVSEVSEPPAKQRKVMSEFSPEVSGASSMLEEGLATTMLEGFMSSVPAPTVAKAEVSISDMDIEVSSARSAQPEAPVMDLFQQPPSTKGAMSEFMDLFQPPSEYAMSSAAFSDMEAGLASGLVSNIVLSSSNFKGLSEGGESVQDFDAMTSVVSSDGQRAISADMMKNLMETMGAHERPVMPEAVAKAEEAGPPRALSKAVSIMSSQPEAGAAAAMIADAMVGVPAIQAMDRAVTRRPSDAEFAAMAADARALSQALAGEALANAALKATLASRAVSEASGIGGTAAADFIDVMQLPSAPAEEAPMTTDLRRQVSDATIKEAAEDATRLIADNAMVALRVPTQEVLSQLGADEEDELEMARHIIEEAQMPLVRTPGASSAGAFTVGSEDLEGSLAVHLVHQLAHALPKVSPRASSVSSLPSQEVDLPTQADIPFAMTTSAGSAAAFTALSEDVESLVVHQILGGITEPQVSPPASSASQALTQEASLPTQGASLPAQEVNIPFAITSSAGSAEAFTVVSEDVLPPASSAQISGAITPSAGSLAGFTDRSEDIEASVAHQILRGIAEPQVSALISSAPRAPTQEASLPTREASPPVSLVPRALSDAGVTSNASSELEEGVAKHLVDALLQEVQNPGAVTPSAGSLAGFTALSEDVEASVAHQILRGLAEPQVSALISAQNPGARPPSAGSLAGFTALSEDVEASVAHQILRGIAEPQVSAQNPGARPPSAGSLAGFTALSEDVEASVAQQILRGFAEPQVSAQNPGARPPSAGSLAGFTALSEDVEASVAHQILRGIAEPQVSARISSAQISGAITPSAGSLAGFTDRSEDIEASVAHQILRGIAEPQVSALISSAPQAPTQEASLPTRALSDAGVASNASSELEGGVAKHLVDELLQEGVEHERELLQRELSDRLRPGAGLSADGPLGFDKTQVDQDTSGLGRMTLGMTAMGLTGMTAITQHSSFMNSQISQMVEADSWMSTGPPEGLEEATAVQAAKRQVDQAQAKASKLPTTIEQLQTDRSHSDAAVLSARSSEADHVDIARQLAQELTGEADLRAGADTADIDAGSRVFSDAAFCIAQNVTHALELSEAPEGSFMSGTRSGGSNAEVEMAEQLTVRAVKAAETLHEASLKADAASSVSFSFSAAELAAAEAPQLESGPPAAPFGLPPLSQRSMGTRSFGSVVLDDASSAAASDAAFVTAHLMMDDLTLRVPAQADELPAPSEGAEASAVASDASLLGSAAADFIDVTKLPSAKVDRVMSLASVSFSAGPSEVVYGDTAFEAVKRSLDAANAPLISLPVASEFQDEDVHDMASEAAKRSFPILTSPGTLESLPECSVASEILDQDMASEAAKRSFSAFASPGLLKSLPSGSDASQILDEDATSEAAKRSFSVFASTGALKSLPAGSVASQILDEDATSEAAKRSLPALAGPGPLKSLPDASVASEILDEDATSEAAKRSFSAFASPGPLKSLPEGSVASEILDEDATSEAVNRTTDAVPRVQPPMSSVAFSVASEVADDDAASEAMRKTMDAAYSHSPILSGRDYSIALSVASEVVDEEVAAEAVKRSLHAVYDCGAVSPPETSVALSVASEVADEDAAAEVVTRCLYEFASPAAIMQEASVHRSIASDVIDEDAASEAVNRSWAGAHDYANAAVSDAAHAARNSSAREPLTPTSVAGESVVTAGASVLIEDMANDMINYAVLRSNLPDADSVVESEARTDQEQAIQQALAEEEARIRAIVDAEIKRLSAEQAELAQQRAAAAANEAIRLATLEAEQLKQLEKEAVLREQQASGALQKVAAQELTLRKAAEKEAEHRAAEEEARSKKAAEKEEERKNAEEKSRLRALAQEEARLQRESGARQTDEQAREEEEQRVKQELARKEAQLRLAAEEEAKQRAEEEERRHLEALELSAVKQSEAEAKARQLVLKEEERVKSERETDSARLRAAQESAAKAQELAEEKAKQAEEKSQEADTARKAASEAASRSPSDDNDILGRLVKSCVNSATSSSVEAKNVPLEGGDTTQTFPRSDDPSLFDLTATATQFPRAAAGAEVTLQFQSTTAGLWASGLAMSSTAPPRIGMGSRQGPEVPSLWEPHSRSDGFNACGWRASPSEVSDSLPASEYTTPRDEEDVVPTFAPKFFADTIPVSQRHDPVDPEAPTLKAPFSHRSAEMEYDNERVPIFVPSSARAGLKQKEHGFSRPVPARSEHLARDAAAASKDQLVDPNIISQLCALLNPPDTPPSEYELIRRGPASTWARSPELSARSLSQRSARSLSQRSAQAIAAPPLPVARKLLSARSDEAMKQVAPAAECGPLKALLHSQRSELQFSPARESGRSVGSQARRVPAKSEASSNAWSAPLGSEATPTPKSLRRKDVHEEGMVEFQEFERYLLAEHPQAEGLPSLPLLGIPGEAAGSAPQTPEQKGGLQEALSRLTQVLTMGADLFMDTGRSSSSTASWKRPLGRHAPTAEDEAATVFKAGAPQHQALRQELEGSLDQQLRRPTEAEISAMAGRIALSKRMDMAQEQQVRLMLQDIANSMFGEAESQQSSARRLPQLPGGSFVSGSRAANSVIGSPSIYTARSSVRSKGSSMSQDMDPIDAAEALELEVAGLMSELCGRVYAPTYDSSSEA